MEDSSIICTCKHTNRNLVHPAKHTIVGRELEMVKVMLHRCGQARPVEAAVRVDRAQTGDRNPGAGHQVVASAHQRTHQHGQHIADKMFHGVAIAGSETWRAKKSAARLRKTPKKKKLKDKQALY